MNNEGNRIGTSAGTVIDEAVNRRTSSNVLGTFEACEEAAIIQGLSVLGYGPPPSIHHEWEDGLEMPEVEVDLHGNALPSCSSITRCRNTAIGVDQNPETNPVEVILAKGGSGTIFLSLVLEYRTSFAAALGVNYDDLATFEAAKARAEIDILQSQGFHLRSEVYGVTHHTFRDQHHVAQGPALPVAPKEPKIEIVMTKILNDIWLIPETISAVHAAFERLQIERNQTHPLRNDR